MQVNKINYPVNSFCAVQQKSSLTKKNKVSPMNDGLVTAGSWFGFGVALDLISRKCQFSKSPFKNSLAINSILGVGAGIYTGIKSLNFKSKNS